MNSQKYLLITLLVFTSRLLIAQNNTCDFYYSGSITYSSFQTDTSIWYGTESNLVEINLNTKEQTRHFLNKEKTIFSTEGGHFAKDSQGQIWFSLGNKRYVWSGVEWQLSSSSFPGIFGGVVDRTDTIWSISNDSVSRFHNDSAYQPLAVDTSFGYVNLVDIAVDSNNNIWVCGDAISKDMGKYPVPFVASYNHQKWTVYIDSLGSELLQGSVRGITFSKDKGLFLSEGGLYELNNGTFKLTYFTEYLRTINLQNDSTYWIGTYGAGVLVNSGKADTSLFLGNSTLNKNYVDEIAVSEEGIVWAAPGRTNLSRFDGATWESISLVGRNYNRRANGVFCHNGTTYVTSYDKLYVNDGLEWKSYDVDLGEGGISMTVDGDGDLFVSSTFRYVYKFDGENFTKYSDFDFSFVNDDYKALATDNDGMVWVAGANKMFYFKDNEWVEFFLPADIKSSSGARKIFFDQNNHLHCIHLKYQHQ